jgi:polyhydroxybutyrate depolymerase
MYRSLLLVSLIPLFLVACDNDTSSAPVASAGPEATMDVMDHTDATGTPEVTEEPFVPFPEAPDKLGGDRPATLWLPKDYDPTEPAPLLLLLHGYSATALVQELYFDLASITREKGLILIAPDGTQDESGNQFWNATDDCCDFYGTGVDDVAYLRGLIEEASTYYAVDSNRIYLLGHSNGGYMSHRMACDAGDVITAIVSLAGVTYLDTSMCEAAHPVSLLQVHGTLDDSVPFEGDNSAPSAMASALFWVGINQCDETSVPGETLDLTDEVPGAETTTEVWTGCTAGTSVALWTMVEGPHAPFFKPLWPESTVDWLLEHSR